MGRPTPVCVSWRIMPAESTGTFRWSHRQVGENKDYTKVTLLLETMLNNRVQKTHHGLCLFLSSKLQKKIVSLNRAPVLQFVEKYSWECFLDLGMLERATEVRSFFVC